MENRIFRGNGKCPALEELNKVEGLPVDELLEKQNGAMGEPDSFVLTARAQISWFLAKHPEGRIETEIVMEDAYRAIVKATVYVGERRLTTGHGASGDNDARIGDNFVAAAETKAIGRALDFAGFGCQLTSKTYEESIPSQNTGTPEGQSDNVMPAMPGEATLPSATPDKFNGALLVQADGNTAAGTTLEEAAPPPKTPRTRKPKADSTAEGASDVNEGAEEGAEQAPANAPESPKNAQEPTGENAEGSAANDGAGPVDEASAPSGATPEPASDTSVEEKLMAAIAEMPDVNPTDLNPSFFGHMFPNGNATAEDVSRPYQRLKDLENSRVSCGDLQKALSYFEANPNEAPQVRLVSTEPTLAGKTIEELCKLGTIGKTNLKSYAVLYRGDNIAVMAATLFTFAHKDGLFKYLKVDG